MTRYNPQEPISGGLADLQKFGTSGKWGIFFARLEIMAQETAIIDAWPDPEETCRAELSLKHMLGLIAPYFGGGEIPEAVHQLVKARARQILTENEEAS